MENEEVKYEYEVKESGVAVNENTVLIRKGLTEEFTIADIKRDIATLQKEIEKQEIEKKIPLAKIQNVKDFHADVIGLIEALSPENQIAVEIYVHNKMKVKDKDLFIDHIKKMIEGRESELKTVEQFITPVEPKQDVSA